MTGEGVVLEKNAWALCGALMRIITIKRDYETELPDTVYSTTLALLIVYMKSSSKAMAAVASTVAAAAAAAEAPPDAEAESPPPPAPPAATTAPALAAAALASTSLNKRSYERSSFSFRLHRRGGYRKGASESTHDVPLP